MANDNRSLFGFLKAYPSLVKQSAKDIFIEAPKSLANQWGEFISNIGKPWPSATPATTKSDVAQAFSIQSQSPTTTPTPTNTPTPITTPTPTATPTPIATPTPMITTGGVKLTTDEAGNIKPLQSQYAQMLSDYGEQNKSYQQQLLDVMSGMKSAYSDYASAIQGQPTALEQYRTLAGELGITDKQKLVDSITQQLNDLEDNINQRASGLGVSQAQASRQLAVEQAPLLKGLQTAETGLTGAQNQLSNMMLAAGTDRQTAQTIAQLPIQEQQSILPILQQMDSASQQKFANMIAVAKEQAPNVQMVGNSESGYSLISYDNNGNIISQKQIIAPSPSTANVPSSYTEWQLAGSPGTYANWIATKGGQTTTGTSDITMQLLNNVNTLLSSDLGGITGFWQTPNLTTRALKNQVINQLRVNSRQYIKGQGAISDTETKMLSDAATTLGQFGLSEKATIDELKKISGIIRANAGESVPVIVSDNGKKIDEGNLNREEIYDAMLQGYQITYQ